MFILIVFCVGSLIVLYFRVDVFLISSRFLLLSIVVVFINVFYIGWLYCGWWW